MIGYEKFGSGPEYVLVFHGWALDHTSFASVLPAVDGGAFTLAFVDYRGCGLSKDQSGDYTIEEIAKDAMLLADNLGWNQLHLIGHSMGGMVVQWIAAHQGSRVKSVVAVTPVPACGAPQMDEAAREGMRRMAESPEGLSMFFTRGTANRHNPAWAKSTAIGSLNSNRTEALQKYVNSWSQTNFVQKVMGSPVPIKVLVGEYDQSITAEAMQQTILRWFAKAELEVLANAGHYPMIEIPINFASACQKYMLCHK